MSAQLAKQLSITVDRRKIAGLPQLSLGDQHPDLVEVQNYLRRFGYVPVDAAISESRLDSATAAALTKFQRF